MSKKNKYLLLGLGVTTLITAAFSPLMYYEIKAQRHISSKEYRKAGNIYNDLSFLSSSYLDRAAFCYYDYFINNYKRSDFMEVYYVFTSNPLIEVNPNTGVPLFVIENKDTTAYQIKEIFKTIQTLCLKQYDIEKGKQKFSATEMNKTIQHVLQLTSKLNLKDKKYLEEAIKAVEVETYTKHVFFNTQKNQLTDALNYLTILMNKYNTLHASSPTPTTQLNIQRSVAKTYFYYKKPLLPDEKQKAFTEKLLEQMQTIATHNQVLVNTISSDFSLQDFLPFRNNNELNDISSNFVHAYQHEYKDFYPLNKRLREEFNKYCYALRKKYAETNSNFSKLNEIYKIIHNDDLKANIQAKQLNSLAQKYSNNKDKPFDDIAALFSIQYHHTYAYQQAKDANPLSAHEHFNSATQIYQKYKTIQKSTFNTHYISLCELANENLLYIIKRNPKKKYLKEMSESLLKSIK